MEVDKSKLTGWNNKVKEVKTIKYEEATLLLIQANSG